MSQSIDQSARLLDLAGSSESWFRDQLRTLVEHPTVSTGGQDPEAVRAGAAAAVEVIRAAGGDAELVETSGTPTVIGAFEHPSPRATLLVYNHLDVQPADPSQWTTGDPFVMGVEEDAERGFIYRGRGTTDDKGPALCALRAASLVRELDLPVTVRLVWETEEEIGSPHFREAIATAGDRVQCDGIIVSDTIWPSAEQPAISVGLRGAVQATLKLRTASKQAHSGLVGGAARNPVRELCALATAIQGARFWQEGVIPADATEIASFAASGFDTEYFRQAHGLERLETEVPLEMTLRLWARPTFEIHGLAGGYTGAGVMSTVPAEAELKISFRLVPDQDPEQLTKHLIAFVEAENPDVEVTPLGRLRPYKLDPSGPIHDAIMASMTKAFGREPVLVREGGSIGAVPILVDELGAPIHFLPLSLPEHGYHAPDENFDWRQARGGIESFAGVFAELASA